ncbi:MAG: alpha/beta hydrolase [Myxococcota bacterium]|nr:alpha/beta hydrolase [Myxococcota bacterium]
MVMGIGYDSTLWTLAQVPALSKKFKVVIFDNRDVGRSSQAKGAYTIADMADDTAALMDALEIKKAHVCGLSMGGMIAMELALRHPDRVDRMILTGAPGAPARAVFHPIQTWTWVKANDKTGETFAGQQFTWLFSSAFLRNKEAVQQTVAMLSSNPNPMGAPAYDRQAQALLKFDVLDRLSGVKAKTLCIVGEQDLLTPVHECREVADAIPGAKFEVIKGDGSSHVVPIERPDDFNGLVTKFLT